MGNKKKLIGAATLAVALAGGGVAGAMLGTPLSSGAQESTASTPTAASAAATPRPAMQAAATAIGISVADLRAALRSGQTIAQVAQAHGVDVNTVVDAMVAEATPSLRARITALVNGERPAGANGRRRKVAAVRVELPVAATALGITPAQLRAALVSGQSIAQVATAHGVPLQTVIDAIVADLSAKIDAQVAAGHLTAARATVMKEKLGDRVTTFVNHARKSAAPQDQSLPAG
ncbi:MAG: hypothetical protein QOI47_2508 [Actinomycetota bacterium]|nr:hypothetical protein [Actinomycetota bacterium]